MTHYLRILTLIYILVLPIVGMATNKYFIHWNINNGLPDNDVKSILHDSKGYLWIGTASGISKYDGYHFTPVFQDDSFIIEDIKSLKEDGNGNIWINNFMVYDCSTGRFTTCNDYLSEIIGDNEQYAIRHIDRNHNLWLFRSKNMSFHNFKISKTVKSEAKFGSVNTVSDNGCQLCVVTDSGRLFRTDIDSIEFIEIKIPENIKSEISGRANGLTVTVDGKIWIHSNKNGALYCYDDRLHEWISLDRYIKGQQSSNLVSAIEEIDGYTWVATDHNGIYVFDDELNLIERITNRPQLSSSLLANDVETLYRDSNGIMWIGYYRNGMSAYNPMSQRFTNHFDLKYGNVSAIIEDNNGNLWVGTDGNGIFRHDISTGRQSHIPIPGNICAWINKDTSGNIWVGTYLNGLLCFADGVLKNHLTQQNSKLANDYVAQMQEDRFGNIWIVSPYGTLQKLTANTGQIESYYIQSSNGVKAELTGLALHYDGGDFLYVGTYFGVYRLDITNGSGDIITSNKKGSQKIHGTTVQNLNLDLDGRLWIGTNQGLTIFDMPQDTLYYINRSNGLCDNVIRGIFNDATGTNWIMTGNGLAMVKTKSDPTDGITFSVRNYTDVDGLMNKNFNGRAYSILKNRNIVLGTENGYCEINPNKLTADTGTLSMPVLTGIKIGNTVINPDQKNHSGIISLPMESATDIYLDYRDDVIMLNFSQMELLSAKQIRYAYHMDCLNDGWIYTSDPRITLTNLPYGDHELLVRSRISDGKWSENIRKIVIHVASPWWLSWWAKCIYIVLAIIGCCIAWRIVALRNKKKISEQQVKMEREQEQHINEMKTRFFTNVSHDMRTPLTLILAPVQIMLREVKDNAIRDRLSLVNRNAERLLMLVNQILDYRKLDLGIEELNCTKDDIVPFVRDSASFFNDYAESHKISFGVTVPDKSTFVEMDFIKIRKVIMNLLSNAFKYTPDGGCVNLDCCIVKNENLVISVSDSGSGICDADKKQIFTRFYQSRQNKDKTGSGIGLHIVHEYVALHKGMITVADNYPTGTVFRLEIPINCVAENAEEVIGDVETQDKDNATRATVLIVDDNSDFIEFLHDDLKKDYEVLTAKNGVEAMKILKSDDIQVDIVVSDVMMPDMDGIELCEHIKTDIDTSHIPVILLTARITDAQKQEGLEHGADDYITKPFNVDILKLRIRKFLEWSEKSHRLFKDKINVEPSEITITPLDEQLIQKAISLVESHISDTDYSVVALSRDLGLTRGHLYKKLKFITGKSPLDFMHTVRVKRGRQLLEKSGMQIAEVAYSVGYNSPKLFSKYFKDEFGITPSEYLKNFNKPE